jgi:hypothetical protein
MSNTDKLQLLYLLLRLINQNQYFYSNSFLFIISINMPNNKSLNIRIMNDNTDNNPYLKMKTVLFCFIKNKKKKGIECSTI